MKQAQLQHPLNWILVVIAGAFFLLLFITIIRSVSDSAGNIDSVETLGSAQAVIEQSKANPGIKTSYSLPLTQTSCSRPGQPFALRIGEQERQLAGQTIFSLQTLEGETTIWSEEYDLVSPITTITYLVNEDVLIVVLQDIHPRIKDLLEPFNVETIAYTELEEKRFRGYEHIVVLSTLLQPLNNIELNLASGQRAYGLEIDAGNPPNRVGDVTFYKYDEVFTQDGASTSYSSESLLIAAIISGSSERYACGLSQIESRMHFLAELNKERIEIIQASSWPNACTLAYDSATLSYATLAVTPLSDRTTLQNERVRLLAAGETLLNEGCPNIR